jgi:hypothetical protein
LPNLKDLSLSYCGLDDDGFVALISALKQNTSLLHLDLRCDYGNVSELAFLALTESLPEIKVLQEVVLNWCTGLALAMPLLLDGLRTNTSLSRFYVAHCALWAVPPRPEEMAKCAWVQETERLGYRNRFLSLIRASKVGLAPCGVWPLALAWVAILPDVIFEVLRSKPSLLPFEDAENKGEAANDTGVAKKRKHGGE